MVDSTVPLLTYSAGFALDWSVADVRELPVEGVDAASVLRIRVVPAVSA